MNGAACWSCAAAATPARIAVEAVIHGRPRSDGGSYRVFRCLACGVDNGILAGPRGGVLLHPLTGLAPPSILDHLLSRAERRRVDRARVWWAVHRVRVERFRRGEPDPDEPRVPPRAAPRVVEPPRAPRPRVAQRRPATTGPRAVLGVPTDATPDEIRRAFRRLAKRHHPDRAAGDSGAAARFRAIRAAYEALSASDDE